MLSIVGIAAYASYVAKGGFYADDWSHAASFNFAEPPRYWSSVADIESVVGGRPLTALLMPAPHALFGLDREAHLALALGLGIATSLCLYLLLRTLAIAPLHSGAIAVLALLFPWSDVIRLWPTGSVIGISVPLALLGVVLALRGLSRGGGPGIAIHAGAGALYFASLLIYEATAGVIALAGLLYFGRASLRTAARRWLADIVVVVAALSYSLSRTVEARHVGSISERIGDLDEFARQSARLVGSALLPVSKPGPVLALVLLAALGTVLAAVVRIRRRPEPELRQWLAITAAAGLAITSSYFIFLGSNLHPGDPGIDMRANAVAGAGFCVLAYAIVATASHLLLRSRAAAAGVTVIAALAIAVGYGVRLRDDEDTWQRAAALQGRVLDAIQQDLAPLPRSSTVLTFGFPAQAGPQVPVFEKSYDLDSAARIHLADRTLGAYPVYRGVKVRCRSDRLVVEGPGDYDRIRALYGRLYFLDVESGATERIEGAGTCREALRSFRPGPLRA